MRTKVIFMDPFVFFELWHAQTSFMRFKSIIIVTSYSTGFSGFFFLSKIWSLFPVDFPNKIFPLLPSVSVGDLAPWKGSLNVRRIWIYHIKEALTLPVCNPSLWKRKKMSQLLDTQNTWSLLKIMCWKMIWVFWVSPELMSTLNYEDAY